MTVPAVFTRLSAVAFAAIWAVAAPAGAQVVSLSADGSYALGSDPLVTLNASFPPSPYVDVLSFPGSGNDYAGLHSYGDASGSFGSRSSGTGVFDVHGSFNIVETLVNSSAAAQHAVLNFNITPGLLSNNVGSPLADGQFVAADIAFDIRVGSSSVWNSSASLRTDAFGTVYSHAGTDLYTANNPTTYTINGGPQSVDLGVIDAGGAITMSYTLTTHAQGISAIGPDRLVPETSFTVPDQWISYLDCQGYGAAAGLAGVGIPGICTPVSYFQAGYAVVIPEHVVPGSVSSAHASSGDPFYIDYNGDPQFYGTAGLPSKFTFGVDTVPIPEPESGALMLAGLAVSAAVLRRRRRG